MTPREVPGLEDALRAGIYAHCFSTTDRELGGVLVGHVASDGIPVVVGAIPAVAASERRAQITFTQESWAEILRELDERHADQQIVGWYHTHPGYGLFLSEQDRFIHRHFFSNPAQIALVIDPVAREEGVFGWVDGEIGEWFRRPVSTAADAYHPPREPLGPPVVGGPSLPTPPVSAGQNMQPRPEMPARPGPTSDARRPPSPPIFDAEVQLRRHDSPSSARTSTVSAPGGGPRARAAAAWLPLATCIYLWVIGLAAGACAWVMFVR